MPHHRPCGAGADGAGAIPVLDAAAAADRELLHVEFSRVSHEFLLPTDDREATIELLRSCYGIEIGARAALGPEASLSEVAVDQEEFRALARERRALRGRTEAAEMVRRRSPPMQGWTWTLLPEPRGRRLRYLPVRISHQNSAASRIVAALAALPVPPAPVP